MSRTIWKFELRQTDVQRVPMPMGAEILTAREQWVSERSEVMAREGHVPMIWALVDPDAIKVDRIIGIVGTGNQVQPHMTPPETWTLTLNRYERDNLLNLVQRVMENDQRPAGWFNTGDWVGEIRWMLGKQYHPGVEKIMRIDEHDRPNPVRELPRAGDRRD